MKILQVLYKKQLTLSLRNSAYILCSQMSEAMNSEKRRKHMNLCNKLLWHTKYNIINYYITGNSNWI